jgi:DNA ligase-1
MTLLVRLAETSDRVGASSARLAKVRELAATLRAIEPDEIDPGVAYLSGLVPQGRIGIGGAALRSAARAASAAAEAPSLSILDVDQRLSEIAAIRGAGSTQRRAAALGELFALATSVEQHFLMRLLLGELRQGAQAGVMLDAIAFAADVPAAIVRRAAMYSDGLGAVAAAALIDREDGLARFQLEIMRPVVPMLAQTAADTDAALEQFEREIALEWKMDGARIQAHKSGTDVRLYTRSLNDVTAAIPEIAAAVGALPAREIVLDGEAIALTASGRPHPFQITMRRFGRKLDVAALQAELPMQAFFFDCLRLDGESLADRPLGERWDALARTVPAALRMPRLVTGDAVAARDFHEEALAAGHEGVMAKALDSLYEAGNRGAGWLKIKRAHTLDLVVLAAEWGSGRRTGKLSNLHLGALEPATGAYVMLGKTFKGLTDAMLEWQTAELLAREVTRDQWTVYVTPELVVEVAFSDLQASTRYPGGFSLRLARVKRYRDDKRAEEADTMDAIRRIYAAQQ